MSGEYGGLGGIAGLIAFAALCLLVGAILTWREHRRLRELERDNNEEENADER